MNYKTNMQLSIIDNLFKDRKQKLTTLAGNLQLNEVKQDSDFEATKQRIKQQVLLEPIVFGEPKITGHQHTTRHVPANFQNPWPMGSNQEVDIVTVDFPFTGSGELLEYYPNGISSKMGHIYQAS